MAVLFIENKYRLKFDKLHTIKKVWSTVKVKKKTLERCLVFLLLDWSCVSIVDFGYIVKNIIKHIMIS